MYNNVVLLVVILCLLLAFSSNAYSETIYFKSGKVIEGKIIERSVISIKVEREGVIFDYYLEDIDHIEEEETEEQKEKPKTPTKNYSPQTKALMDLLPPSENALLKKDFTAVVSMLESKIPLSVLDGDGTDDYADAYGQACYNLGIAYLNLNELDKAIEILERCRSVLPKWPAPYYLLGQTYYKNEQFKMSGAHFKQAFRMDSSTATAKDYFYFLVVNLRFNNRMKAQQLFDIGKRKFPNNFKAGSLAEIERRLR